MPTIADLPVPVDGKLAANILHFARALRRAGLPVGTGRIVDAIRAVEAAGFTDREDFFHTLQACFVSRPEHRQVFAQMFRLYWRDPQFLEHMMSLLMPALRGVSEARDPADAERRAAEALLAGAEAPPLPPRRRRGRRGRIRRPPHLHGGRAAPDHGFRADVARRGRGGETRHRPARSRGPPLPSRRTRPSPRGRAADWRSTLRRALRTGGEVESLVLKARRTRWPNLVALCDISGSMASYSRMILHFLHAVANQKGAGWAQVHAFTFGTRLTNITRHLRTRDVDAALAAAGREARDWEGGTRIGACLHEFNRDWSRRVLPSGAVVLLITDGLDRDDPDRLAREIERLHLSARKLIWLNPLLRWDGFAPRAGGIRAILPHVDSFRACHSIASLEDLAAALSRPEDAGERARLLARL